MPTQRPSRHWLPLLHPLLRAVLASLVTIAALSALVTVLVWHYEVDRLAGGEHVAVLHAVVDSREQQVLLFSRTIARHSPAGSEYQVSLRDLRPGRPQHEARWQAVSLIDSPGGAILGDANGMIRRLSLPWSGGEGELIGKQPEGAPVKMNCSADGRRLLSQSEAHLYLWDLQARRLIQRLPRGGISEAVLSADGERYYHACEQGLVERAAASGAVRRTFLFGCEPLELACSPDGGRLAVLECDGRLTMLQLSSGERLWQEHLSEPRRLAATLRFSPRGESIVTARQPDDDPEQWIVEVRRVLDGERQAGFAASQRVFGAAITARQTVQSWGTNGSFCQWNLSNRVNSGADRCYLSSRQELHARTAIE